MKSRWALCCYSAKRQEGKLFCFTLTEPSLIPQGAPAAQGFQHNPDSRVSFCLKFFTELASNTNKVEFSPNSGKTTRLTKEGFHKNQAKLVSGKVLRFVTDSVYVYVHHFSHSQRGRKLPVQEVWDRFTTFGRRCGSVDFTRPLGGTEVVCSQV